VNFSRFDHSGITGTVYIEGEWAAFEYDSDHAVELWHWEGCLDSGLTEHPTDNPVTAKKCRRCKKPIPDKVQQMTGLARL